MVYGSDIDFFVLLLVHYHWVDCKNYIKTLAVNTVTHVKSLTCDQKMSKLNEEKDEGAEEEVEGEEEYDEKDEEGEDEDYEEEI